MKFKIGDLVKYIGPDVGQVKKDQRGNIIYIDIRDCIIHVAFYGNHIHTCTYGFIESELEFYYATEAIPISISGVDWGIPAHCDKCKYPNTYKAPANRPNGILICGSCRSFESMYG